MTKHRNAVIAGSVLLLVGLGHGSIGLAAQPGVAAGHSAPRGGATGAMRAAPATPQFASAAPRGAGPSVAPRFAPAPANRNFNGAIGGPPSHSSGVATRQYHVPAGRGRAPFVPTAPQFVPKVPPAVAWNRHERREHHGRRPIGRAPYGYPFANPYFYGIGAGVGVPYVTNHYLYDNGAYRVCFPLLQEYRETGSAKWRKRYDRCLAGDYSQLDYLDD